MRLRVGLAVCVGMALSAAEWAPIPQAVWDMKEDPARGVKGAVVLESRMIFTGRGIDHVERIRILSEAGRDAAEFDDFLPEARDFGGRTSYRDGRSVAFDGRKDFSVKTLKGDEERKILIPPGVTADCVVEVRWSDYASEGEGQLPPSLGRSGEWSIGGRYPIQEVTLEFWPAFHWNVSLLAGKGITPEVSRNGRKYVLRNLPGREVPPYSLRAMAGLPTLLAWEQPSVLEFAERDATRYWPGAASFFWKPFFKGDVVTGGAFKALHAELAQGLPPDPAQAAGMLLRRLERRVKNVSHPTLAEISAIDIKAVLADRYGDSRDLDRIARRGAASSEEMTLLFLALLDRSGIRTRLGLLKDRRSGILRFDVADAHQAKGALVGVVLPDGGTRWFDPDLRFAAPGLVAPSNQGVPAVIIDTSSWQATRGTIPFQPETFNTSKYDFTHAFGNGTRSFTMKAAFSGWPEYRQRIRYMPLSPQEQVRRLKESLEAAIPDAAIASPRVTGADDPDRDVALSAEGTLETAADDAIVFAPFPGVPSPLPMPASWPAARTEHIILDHLGIHVATCEFQVPAGYVFKAGPPFSRENSFGKVFLGMESREAGGTARGKAVLRVDVRRPLAPPEAYGEFRTFMGWVDEAFRSQLVLEKR